MIQVDNLGIGFQGHNLFTDAKFTLQSGEKCGFVGRNGSGKSTFFKILTGREVSDAGSVAIQRHYTIGMLDQHLHFHKETILEEAALGLPENEKDFLYKAETILFGLGFTEKDMDAPISSFSGGFQLRLHLAKLLISEPRCLLLDEPTNYLDILSIRWLTKFLKEWKGEFILISHDREFMDSVATHTMGIHRGKIRKAKGSTVDFFGQILLEEEIHEKTRINVEKKRAHAQSFIDRFGAKATKAGQAQSRQKMLDKIPTLERLKELYQLDFHFHEAPFFGKKMLHAANIDFSYNEKPLIQNFSIEIEKGDRIAIVGKNGRGKSTLLRLLANELKVVRGVLKHSENLAIGYFGQTNIDRLNSKHTVTEEIGIANPKLNITEVKSIAGLMMFTQDQSSKLTSVLSGGEKSRVLLGKIIAKPCNILLLDEPTHHLDMESIEALIDAVENFDGAVVLVTHSELILKRLVFDKIVVCHEAKQEVFFGSYREFLEKEGWHDGGEEKSKPAAKKIIAKTASTSVQTLERKISALELLIAKLEKEQGELSFSLLKAPSEKLQELSRSFAQKQKEVEQLQEELQELYNQL